MAAVRLDLFGGFTLSSPDGTPIPLSARKARAGAGSGIGQATARLFLDRGWHVGLIGRRPEPLHQTADGHEDRGFNHAVVQAQAHTAGMAFGGQQDKLKHANFQALRCSSIASP